MFHFQCSPNIHRDAARVCLFVGGGLLLNQHFTLSSISFIPSRLLPPLSRPHFLFLFASLFYFPFSFPLSLLLSLPSPIFPFLRSLAPSHPCIPFPLFSLPILCPRFPSPFPSIPYFPFPSLPSPLPAVPIVLSLNFLPHCFPSPKFS